MNKLDRFINELCGIFNNDRQINDELESGELKHPKAKHINGVCNDKILIYQMIFQDILLLKKVIMSKENLKIFFRTYSYLQLMKMII